MGPQVDISDLIYATATSKLGELLVAATTRGVCAVILGDSRDGVVTELNRLHPKRQCRRSSSELENLLEQIIAILNGTDEWRPFACELDIRGTCFQKKVWDELQRIPRGEVRSYRDVAKAIGAPLAVRAVAQACASNPVCLVIPCHRVVRSDGALSGYRWGIARKEAILRQENAAYEGVLKSR
jgi:AraC family transcriptional regulator of adaptative response/methylated-DNA-[protein]-cysteine methyltransferase